MSEGIGISERAYQESRCRIHELIAERDAKDKRIAELKAEVERLRNECQTVLNVTDEIVMPPMKRRLIERIREDIQALNAGDDDEHLD